jgi:hypothetical protein
MSSGLSGRTAAALREFRAEESTDGTDLSKMTPQQQRAWAEKIRIEAAERMERLAEEGRQQRQQQAEQARQRREQAEVARKADEERSRQQTQQVLMNAVREELKAIFDSATATEWDQATKSVARQGLIGTLLAPDAYRLALQEIRRSK